MNYEAVMLDVERGHHRRGVGPSPVIAAMNALRKVYVYELVEQIEGPIDVKAEQMAQQQVEAIGPVETVRMLCMVNVDDEHMENPKVLKEDVNDQKILVRVDRTKETMYVPCGWIRPIF